MLDYSFDQILIILSNIIIALTIHELAHAGTALLLGDDTAKLMGRVTLNPIRHIDPIGMLMIVLVGFGWAKPVIFNPNKLKEPQRDEILISLAGPFSNLLLALLYALGLKLLMPYMWELAEPFNSIVYTFLLYGISVNSMLFLFNLLPIPPLDGSHIVTAVISQKSFVWASKYVKYGPMILIAILIFQNFTDIDILPISRGVRTIMDFIFKAFKIQ